MSKRCLITILAILFILTGLGIAEVWGDPTPRHENVIYQGSIGASKVVPPQYVLRVRNSWKPGPTGTLSMNPDFGNIHSGDAVIWDMTSADGVSVTKVEIPGTSTSAANFNMFAGISPDMFAGIAVTDIATSDLTTLDPADKSWGYICTKGYCLVSLDAATAIVAGDELGFSGMWAGALTRTSRDVVYGSVQRRDAVVSLDIISLYGGSPTGGNLYPVIIR